MKRRILWVAILIAATAFIKSAAAEPPLPNIVFFYADDLGYGDLACYGSEVAQTPRLDRLAGEGTRFTQFYVSHCVCSPTRTSAITGHFPGRHRIYGHLSFFEQNRKRSMPDWLDVAAPSFPRALQGVGYRTAMIGKWHLGGGSGRTFRISDLKNPNADRSGRSEIVINHPDAPPVVDYGFDYARTTIGNGPTWKDGKPWPEAHDVYPYLDEGWVTWSSRAIAEDTIRFLKDHQREHGDHPFYVNVWFKDVHTPHKPTEEMRAPFLHLDEKPQAHYAMVRFMDEQIGRVLNAVNELGLDENTIVLFSSDNGAGRERGGSNGPLRGWKHSLYEGGIRVPLIVRWPGRIPAGRVDESSVLNLCDLVPTLSKLTGAKMPKGYLSDGEDVFSAWQGGSFVRTKAQFWHYPSANPALGIRKADWKLLMSAEGNDVELYHLKDDPAETDNLADAHPAVVESLKPSLAAWYGELPIAGGTKR